MQQHEEREAARCKIEAREADARSSISCTRGRTDHMPRGVFWGLLLLSSLESLKLYERMFEMRRIDVYITAYKSTLSETLGSDAV